MLRVKLDYIMVHVYESNKILESNFTTRPIIILHQLPININTIR